MRTNQAGQVFARENVCPYTGIVMDEREIPSTGDARVDAALSRIRHKFSELEDAMLVQVHLEAKAGKRIKEHAEFIARHEEAIRSLDIRLAEIAEKANFLFDREMRREGGPEIA